MNDFDKIRKGECPNDHGPLILFKKPISILYLLPEDLLDLGRLDEAEETPENMFGYIIGICQECGFVLSTAPIFEYDYDSAKWGQIEEEASNT